MYFVSLRLTVYLRRILEVKEYSKGKKLVKCYDGINVKEIAFGNKEHTTDSKIGGSKMFKYIHIILHIYIYIFENM